MPIDRKPILKPRINQLSILPAPPTVNRPPPVGSRDESSPPKLDRGDDSSLPFPRPKTTLQDAIDYDKFTPTQQMRLDNGMFGAIELKEQHPGRFYYYLRWQDPANNKKRSTYLGKEWEVAKAKLRQLTARSV
jgi:hypothetical protein